jgi:hypothetical protein
MWIWRQNPVSVRLCFKYETERWIVSTIVVFTLIYHRHKRIALTCWARNVFSVKYEQIWQHLWSSGKSSWLQVQRSGFDSRYYQIFWEVVGLERGPLSLVNTIEELRGRKSSGSSLESQEYSRRDPSRWPRSTLYPQKLKLTSSTNSDRSVGIIPSRTQTTEYSFSFTDKLIDLS